MIKDFKDFEKFLKICRKQGVFEAECNGIKIKLGDMPIETRSNQGGIGDSDPVDALHGFPQGELTPTQLMFYSAGGLPQDDPELNQ